MKTKIYYWMKTQIYAKKDKDLIFDKYQKLILCGVIVFK